MSTSNIFYSNQLDTVSINEKQLPILYDVDAVIVGGSFAGISLAKNLAENGKTVAIVESRTYLGREVSATLRPWVINQANRNDVPEIMREIINRGEQKNDEIALYIDQVKTHLEDVVLDKGVSLLYASYPTGLYTEESGDKLLVIGNKSGRQIVRAKVIIDTTETASVLHLAGENFESNVTSNRSYWKTIEFYRTDGLTDHSLDVPEYIGVDGHTVHLHQGYLENGHVFLEFKVTMDNIVKGTTLDRVMSDEIASRHTMMKLSEYLIQNHPAFKNAYLAASSFELQPTNFKRLIGSVDHSFDQIVEVADDNKFSLLDFASTDPRLWCVNESARDSRIAELLINPLIASSLGEKLAEQLNQVWDKIVQTAVTANESKRKMETIEGSNSFTVREQDVPEQGRSYQKEIVPDQDIPVLYQTDVLVVGGGTSGATAAITSAKEGMDTVLLEMNPGLGGTATLGAVDSYWFGRRVGFNQFITEKVNEVQQRLNHKSPKWNIEAKMYALLNEAEKAGVNTYFYTTTIGTIMDGNRVKGVVVASKWGTFAVMAKTVIDATGDGDIAAFAGAEYVYGAERDHVVMWYSLPQFAKPGRSQNNFTSAVQISNIVDYTRAILDGRRRKRNRDVHDHGIYVASRETRHILGEVVMTMTDQLRYRQWDDVINIHFSNHDMKGKSTADWMNVGLIPPNLEIEIPYRMVLPKGIEGLLVAGKAISATHDGFAAIRMQSDLENLGGIVAIAAAQAIKNQQLPSEINVKELQKRVVKEGMLPEEIIERKAENKEYQDDELATLVDSLKGDKKLYEYADMPMDEVYDKRIPFVEVCTVGPRVIPYLKKALDEATEANDVKRQVVLAQALAMYESSYGVPVLIREIEKELTQAGDELPRRDNDIAYTQLPPDHGAMPDVCYLLYSLGMTRDARSIPIWREVAEKINPSVESLKDMFIGTFYYVDAVCYGIERLVDPQCIEILEKLYSYDYLRNQKRTGGIEPDYFKERQAMLELSIVRALARCGEKKGYQVLIDYLNDTRSLLAEQAHTELKLITGKDFQKNQVEWTNYIESIVPGTTRILSKSLV